MTKHLRVPLLSAFLLAVCLFPAAAVDLVGVGSYTEIVNASDLTGGAGTNLTSSYESGAAQIQLSVTEIQYEHGFRVDVRRSDVSWHASLIVSVRRTGDGTGVGTISGGLSYQAVGTSSAAFFSGTVPEGGTYSRLLIPVQVQVSGVSVLIPPHSYSTHVIFTGTEN